MSILPIQISHHNRSKTAYVMINALTRIMFMAHQMTSRTKLKRKQVDDVLGKQDFGADETTGKNRVQHKLTLD